MGRWLINWLNGVVRLVPRRRCIAYGCSTLTGDRASIRRRNHQEERKASSPKLLREFRCLVSSDK